MSPRTKTRTAAPPVTATEVAVLGLLMDGERSGYDLLRQAERSVGFFWTPAKTQLYAVLRKLVDNGFATARRVRQTERLEEIEQTFDHDEHLFGYLTLLRGKANAAADAAWAEQALALLERRR